jgi:hypothetical protein
MTPIENFLVPYDSITRVGIAGKYQRMADAINQVAKETRKLPFIFSLCEWGWVSEFLHFSVEDSAIENLLCRAKFGCELIT